jgi:hypothetical protein
VIIAVGFDIFPIEIVTGCCVAIPSRQVFQILHPVLTSEVGVPLMSGVIQPRKATQVSIVLRQGAEVQFDDVDAAHSAVVTDAMLVLHGRRLEDDERIEDAVEEVEQGLIVMMISLGNIKFNC